MNTELEFFIFYAKIPAALFKTFFRKDDGVMAGKKVIHLGTVRDRKVEGLTWEDKKKILDKIASEVHERVHCNGARVTLPRVEEKE